MSKRPLEGDVEVAAAGGEASERKQVKVEERFCVVCQDHVSGEVAICPKNEHWVCSEHLKVPSFNKCPLCKTPWLRARDHDLLDDGERKRPVWVEPPNVAADLMRNEALTLEEMLAQHQASGQAYWDGWTDSSAQRLALANDRNWAFFTSIWENAANRDRKRFYFSLVFAHNWMGVIGASTRFWEWILPRYGEVLLVGYSVFHGNKWLDIPFDEANVASARLVLDYCRARQFPLMDKKAEHSWVGGWLSHGLEATQQMCELLGFQITREVFEKMAAWELKDPAVLLYARTHFPDVGPRLFVKITENRTGWEQMDEAFLAELMEFKPPGWIYNGASPRFQDFRPLGVYNRPANQLRVCAWIDWQTQGTQAPMKDQPWFWKGSLEMVVAPEGKAEPMFVQHLYMVYFEKYNVRRLYAADQAYDKQYLKLREALTGKEIHPPNGTIINVSSLHEVEFERANLF